MITKITLSNFTAQVEIEDETLKTKHFKTLSLNRFKDVVCKTYNVDSGVMPLGTIAYKKKGNGDSIAIVQGAQFREVKYCPGNNSALLETYNIAIPPLVWLFNRDINHRIIKTYLIATKDVLVTETSAIYCFPFALFLKNFCNFCFSVASIIIVLFVLLEKPTIVGL